MRELNEVVRDMIEELEERGKHGRMWHNQVAGCKTSFMLRRYSLLRDVTDDCAKRLSTDERFWDDSVIVSNKAPFRISSR
jgi:hypothetical protein